MRKNHWLLRKIRKTNLNIISATQSDLFRYEVEKLWYSCCRVGKHSKLSSSIEWRLEENVVLRTMVCYPQLLNLIYLQLFHICLSADPPWSSKHWSSRCAQQRKYIILGKKQLQKNGTWQFWTTNIKQKSIVTLTVVS